MATRTVTALFERYEDAADAVRRLEAEGVSHDDISIVSNDASHAQYYGAIPGDAEPMPDQPVSGTGAGASLGSVLGGGAGLLAGLGLLAIPGLGPVVAAGWLASTLVGAGIGAAAGGIVGSLTDVGVSETDAQAYAEGVHRGGTLVTARVAGAMVERVTDALDHKGAIDLSMPRSAESLDDAVGQLDDRREAPVVSPVGDPAMLAGAGLLPEPEPAGSASDPNLARADPPTGAGTDGSAGGAIDAAATARARIYDKL